MNDKNVSECKWNARVNIFMTIVYLVECGTISWRPIYLIVCFSADFDWHKIDVGRWMDRLYVMG